MTGMLMSCTEPKWRDLFDGAVKTIIRRVENPVNESSIGDRADWMLQQLITRNCLLFCELRVMHRFDVIPQLNGFALIRNRCEPVSQGIFLNKQLGDIIHFDVLYHVYLIVNMLLAVTGVRVRW
ncbi:MAG: hypothetical protein ACR2PS_05755 [Pseudomonadales bacterium]